MVRHLQFQIDSIADFSRTLNYILDLYLQASSNFLIGNAFKCNRIPRIRILRHIRGLSKQIDEHSWGKFFNANWRYGSVENQIGELYTGFYRIIKHASSDTVQENIVLSGPNRLKGEYLYGIGSDKQILEGLIAFFETSKHRFTNITLNGSIGSLDFKPGWSDIDVFVMLKKETLQSENQLKRTRQWALELKQKIYEYCILQLHDAFYSTEYSLKYLLKTQYPLPCIINGGNFSNLSNLTFEVPISDNTPAYYMLNDIYRSAKHLLSIKNHLSLIQKVLLIHRIYSFPFAFLSCQGIHVYKRESFQILVDNYADRFEGLAEFYGLVNELYHNWRIDRLRTVRLRRLLGKVFELPHLNRWMLPLEKDIAFNVRSFFDFLLSQNVLSRFERYLEIGRKIVTEAGS